MRGFTAVLCPGTDNFIVTLNADGRSCVVGKVEFPVGPDCAFAGANPSPPGEVMGVTLRKSILFLLVDWLPVPGADVYNVYRGRLDSIVPAGHYSHIRDAGLGAGACSEITTTFADTDDLADHAAFYYLVTASLTCGLEGTPGFSSYELAGGGGMLGEERPSGSVCP